MELFNIHEVSVNIQQVKRKGIKVSFNSIIVE